jgi:hypothetical protein
MLLYKIDDFTQEFETSILSGDELTLGVESILHEYPVQVV